MLEYLKRDDATMPSSIKSRSESAQSLTTDDHDPTEFLIRILTKLAQAASRDETLAAFPADVTGYNLIELDAQIKVMKALPHGILP